MKTQERAPWTEQLEPLRAAPVSALVARYEELFGEQPHTRNRTFLLRRLAWRLQANLYGGLAERARRRALEIADDRDFRLTAPLPRRPAPGSLATPLRDPRLPLPGAILKRHYRGQEIEVQVLADGFSYKCQRYPSLSRIAEVVTGTRWNGFVFFQLQARKHAA